MAAPLAYLLNHILQCLSLTKTCMTALTICLCCLKSTDYFSGAKIGDLIALTKQDVRELLSAVRRKDSNGIQACLTSRRKTKKMIQKSLKNLRILKNQGKTLSLEKDVLKDAESVTLSLFECFLSHVMGTKVQQKKNGWSLVSMLMHSKKVSPQGEETYLKEFKKVDLFLQFSQENGVAELVNLLKEMASSIQILEVELEHLFRQLIKTKSFPSQHFQPLGNK